MKCFWCNDVFTFLYFPPTASGNFCSKSCCQKSHRHTNLLGKTSKKELIKLEREKKLINLGI